MSMIRILSSISFSDLLRLDVLFWVAILPLLIISLGILLLQYRQNLRLRREWRILKKSKRRAVEYDLVLKAMKLSVWHIDVQARTITYDCDYRDSMDIKSIAPNSDVELFCNNLLPEYKERVAKSLKDLIEGHVDKVREQYCFSSVHSDRLNWGEMFAIVDKRDADGTPLSVVGTSMLIDKQKEIEQELIEARNHAEESDRLKTAFLANISHEVRTPLNAIVGFSEVLSECQNEEERAQLAALIKENNDRLLHLFEDMVSLSRLEASGGTINKSRFKIDEMFKEVIRKYRMDAIAKRLSLQIYQHSEDLEPYTDYSRLMQIVNHYVENALKFTAEGGVTLGCNKQLGHLRVWVSDTGKGIAPENCTDKLFERFVKIDEFEQGTGLGLSVCRSLAMSLGGNVGVESQLGKGSRFWVEIPFE